MFVLCVSRSQPPGLLSQSLALEELSPMGLPTEAEDREHVSSRKPQKPSGTSIPGATKRSHDGKTPRRAVCHTHYLPSTGEAKLGHLLDQQEAPSWS